MLKIVEELVNNLHKNRLLYCHWKSNEHLEAAVKGDTDLDILFSFEQRERIEKTIYKSNFIKFRAVWYLKYDFVKDYLGIDNETGRLVHIHAHFKLVFGEKRVKSYIFPFENDILSSSIWDEEHGIYRSLPTYELFLLFLRQAIKMPGFSRVPYGRSFNSLKEKYDILREYNWLISRLSIDDIQNNTFSSLVLDKNEIFSKLYNNGFERKLLSKLYSASISFLKQNCRYSNFSRIGNKFIRTFFYYSDRILKILGSVRPVHRTFLKEGKIIVLLGADGSGKSTQVKKIKKILSAKVDTIDIYMGSGNGKSSLLRYPLIIILMLKHKYWGYQNEKEDLESGNTSYQKSNKIKLIWKILWSVSVLFEKQSKVRKIIKAKSRGMFVICDRYPQTFTYGYNDGPLLQGYSNSKSKILRFLAEWELNKYNSFVVNEPDLVIKLLANESVLLNRRNEMTTSEIEKKQEGIKKLKFSEGVYVSEIDCSKSLNNVTIDIMKKINRILLDGC